WDMFVLVVFVGIIGARLWYVITATLGGSPYYLQNPIQILNVRAGGLNIFGALLAGLVTIILFCRAKRLNFWMYLDFVAPGVLLGQGLARWGNYINQELYGPPTTLPWGIPIDAQHRIPPYDDLSRFPLSTRFHPTFLYETIYDLLAFGLLMYLLRRLGERWKIGSVFGAYLILHGTGRFIIEFFRPDQPRIPGTDFSYSRLLSVLFVIGGAVVLYWRQQRAEPYPAPALPAEPLAAAEQAEEAPSAVPEPPAEEQGEQEG
ncbi:MAG: prolipoprotein diacylglyceryl transferase, partial [Anaerolineae bacterium]